MAMFLFQTKAIEDNIEDLLASLDEFSHLADTVSSSLFETNSQSSVIYCKVATLFAHAFHIKTRVHN